MSRHRGLGPLLVRLAFISKFIELKNKIFSLNINTLFFDTYNLPSILGSRKEGMSKKQYFLFLAQTFHTFEILF